MMTYRDQISGDNGQYSWCLCPDGGIEILEDEAEQKRRQVRRHSAEMDYFNPKSSIFSLSYEGISVIESIECYVVKTTNSINDDYTLSYYDTSSFLPRKELAVQFDPVNHTHELLFDHEWMFGLLRATRREIRTSNKISYTLKILEVKTNIAIDSTLFEPLPRED